MDKVGLKDESGNDGLLVRSVTVFVSQYKERVVLVPGLGKLNSLLFWRDRRKCKQTEQGNRDNSMGY